ncbi:methylmalonyl-CoA mutase family protein [Alkalihalobacterium bogoriense]|uniref:methylmalonyl-CoA mutase family protein n=1 Tax=Alkalihalobacterium bogoriense TaxID=246272 RepID=UPI000478908B|nr:methylmalonyl-CoA mutase family protein [Alkalihalobacterium bogoriense]
MEERKQSNRWESFAEFPIPTYEQWKTVAEQSLKGAAFEKLLTDTYEGITLSPMYQKDALETLEYIENWPGERPFVRGNEKKTKVKRAWEISQEIDMASPRKWNEVAKHALSTGQTELNMVVDVPTRRGENGRGSNHAGDAGLSVFSSEHMEAALQGIAMEEVPLFVYCGATVLPLLSIIGSAITKSGTPLHKLTGCIGADPVGELLEQGEIPYTMQQCLKQMSDVLTWSKEHTPSLQTILVRGEVYHNGGASAVEELACTLATGAFYLAELSERGHDVQQIASSIRFSFAVGSNYFMEMAKLRAARLLWSNIVRVFGGNDEAQKMWIHGRTSAWTKTKYDPYVNMLRGTTEAFAAAVGGANSIHVSQFDEALGSSTEFSRRIARNTSIILQEESHIGITSDPVGGSWYVESLTNEVGKQTWAIFQQIEAKGGIFSATQQQFVQKMISKTEQKKIKNVMMRKDVIVGTNRYSNKEERAETRHSDKQAYLSEHLKASDHLSEQNISLSAGTSVVTQLIEAAKAGALLSDLAKACNKGTAKEQEQVIRIKPNRAAIPFERIREAYEGCKQSGNDPIELPFLLFGSVASHKPRMDFAQEFFQVGGFDISFYRNEESTETVLAKAKKEKLIVLCGADEEYRQEIPNFISDVKQQIPDCLVYVVGLPTEEEQQQFKEAGVDRFIHRRTNCYEELCFLLEKKGVTLT